MIITALFTKFQGVDFQSIFVVLPALRDSSMQGIFRQVEKDDEDAPLTQGIYHEF